MSRFTLVLLASLVSLASVSDAALTIEDTGQAYRVLENGAPVFVYNYDEVQPPEGVKPNYARENYIHPLYGTDGSVLTEDFPTDHYHHRGIFWAWPLTSVGGKTIDVWALIDSRSHFTSWEVIELTDEKLTVKIRAYWAFDASPETHVVDEEVLITIHAAAEGKRAIDFDLNFTNVAGDVVTFLGATNKGYGGFNYRPDKKLKPMKFTSALGEHTRDALRLASPWADVTFTTDASTDKKGGVAIFQHPDNPGYPHIGWILRHYSFLGVCWPHEETFELEQGKTMRLRYRLLTHERNAHDAGVEVAFAQYSKDPPR